MSMVVSCAGLGTPGGGPEDKTPPTVVSISPPDGSVRVSPDTEIIIEFSEPIDEISLKSSIFVSPAHNKTIFKVSGKKVIIKSKDGIPVDQVMTVTIGTGAKDLHGNPLFASITTALTTGEKISGGEINGRIYGDMPLSGVLIGAWFANDTAYIEPDTILPPFLTQSGELGTFSFRFLPEDLFRIVCWEDRNRDKFYQPGVDRIGLASKDVSVASDSSAWLDLALSKHDTSRLNLLMIYPFDNQHVHARFSKKPDAGIVEDWKSAMEFSDSSRNLLQIYSIWFDPLDSTRLTILTDKQISDEVYTYQDESDIRLSFTGTSASDTTGPDLVKYYPAENSRDVPQLAKGILLFDDIIDGDSLLESISLNIQDSIPYPITVSKTSPNSLEWQSVTSLPPNARCLLSIDLTKLFDSQGNVSGDTTKTIFFTTIDPANKGEISGRVTTGRKDAIIVAAKQTSGGKNEYSHVTTVANRDFVIRNLPPGDYGIWCWSDEDNDRFFDQGNLNPFQHSEAFIVLQDTISVRARWETEGIILNFP